MQVVSPAVMCETVDIFLSGISRKMDVQMFGNNGKLEKKIPQILHKLSELKKSCVQETQE